MKGDYGQRRYCWHFVTQFISGTQVLQYTILLCTDFFLLNRAVSAQVNGMRRKNPSVLQTLRFL